MKLIALIIILAAGGTFAFAQSDLEKLVATEKAFAQLALEKGTKHAFLENITNDAVLFLPDRVNAKEYWSTRGESAGALIWAPNFAAVSSSGILGYTTGNWEYRPKGKDDAPVGFGEFVTVWLRQPSGVYKFVVDIGIEHDKPGKYLTEWTTFTNSAKELNEDNTSAADTANQFFQLAAVDLAKAYKQFAADDIRMFREKSFPVTGKKQMSDLLKREKGIVAFAKRSSSLGSADLAYITSTYTLTVDGKSQKGNFLQMWRLRNGRWQIVLDIFKPITA